MPRSEFEIIQQYFSRIGLGAGDGTAWEGIVLGIGDDAAILELPATLQQCLSTDMLVESVHFPVQATAFAVGQRALAVNLSDLAAMGAQPLCFTLAVSLPHHDESWLENFSAGLLSMAQQYRCPLVGGDTTRGPLAIAIQVHGVATKGQLLRRDGAQAGDAILVTGSLGKGAIALAAMGEPVHFDASLHEQLATIDGSVRERLQSFFYAPLPRLEFAQQAAPWINSAIDISDGLAGDLQHILQASSVGASINPLSIPYDAAVEQCTSAQQRQAAALFGGDDYELCITVSPNHLTTVRDVAEKMQLSLTQIGDIDSKAGLRVSREGGVSEELTPLAYDHFRNNEQP